MKCIDTCIQYLSSINKNRQQIFLVISGKFPKIDLDELLDTISELDGFVYFWCCQNEMNNNYIKRDFFSNEQDLIKKIAKDFHNVQENKFCGLSTHDFNVNRIRYKCFQLLIEVLQRMPSPREMAKENMIKYCEIHNGINLDEKVEEFRNQYVGDNAITWYSRQSFFKKIFDRDLRSTDFNLISNFNFYLIDLYNALNKKFQTSFTQRNELIVYRGLPLPKCELEEFKGKVGCLVSNNTFLSTTCQKNIALTYAMNNNDKPSYQSVLFDIHIKNKNIRRPFADISDVSRIDGEILIAIGTIFRIDSVCEPQSNQIMNLDIWTIKLTVCEKEPPALDDYFDIVLLRLIEILRRMSPDNDQANMKLLERCRIYYAHDPIELRKIDDFEKNYTTDQAIRWYTKDSFLFRILNTALRQNDMKNIIDLRFFIFDLHDQLSKTQIEYLRTLPVNARQIKLYRGQFISKIELTKLKKSVDNYILVTSFFSTSTNEQVALMYSGYGLQHYLPSFESVLFIITINLHQMVNMDKSNQRVIFARLDDSSSFQDDEEVLLSNHTIFYLNRIEKRSDYPIWSIHMTLCIDDQYLDNTHQYLNIILSPVIRCDLNNNNSFFSFKNMICLDDSEKIKNEL
jgi:hypothetical protein